MIKINKQLFWDVDFAQLEYKKNADFIISRILEYGDEKDVAWLFSHFKKNQIKQTLLKKRGISCKSANYWALILGVSIDRILCLNKQFQKKLQKVWPY